MERGLIFEMVTIVSYNETIKKENIGTMKNLYLYFVPIIYIEVRIRKGGI